MAHEIEEFDNVVLNQKPAWHGLGIVVEHAPTPREALKIAGLDWPVEQWPISATNGETRVCVPDKVVNVRTDHFLPLGVVGKDWTPFQNSDLADFCEALAEQNDTIKLESAGSIRNGAKVWMLIRGESFSVRAGDEVKPYICVSNGFDGMTALRCTPTTVRVVCSNTLHMVIPRFDNENHLKVDPAAYVVRHTGSLMERVEEAKAALKLYGKAVHDNRILIDALAATNVSRDDIQRFFLECYTRDFGGIADVPTTAKEKRHREDSQDAYLGVATRFDRERDIAGPTAWNLLNAYTGWMQHDKKPRYKDEIRRAEATIHSNLFGANAERTATAFATALALAG